MNVALARRSLLVLLIATALSTASPPAHGCAQVTVDAEGVAFGTYDPAERRPLDSHGEIRVTCLDPEGEPTTVELALSAGNSTRFDHRELSRGDRTLRYNLYLDPGRTLVWGDGTGPSQTAGATVSGAAGGSLLQSFPVYGTIFAEQGAPSGVYGDSIVVSVIF